MVSKIENQEISRFQYHYHPLSTHMKITKRENYFLYKKKTKQIQIVTAWTGAAYNNKILTIPKYGLTVGFMR